MALKNTIKLLCLFAGAAHFSPAAAPSSLAVVNAATYVSQIAPSSIASAFGANLPTDSATGVMVCQPGTPPSNCLQATIFSASATQINFLVPPAPLSNPVLVEVLHAGAIVASGSVALTNLSPGIFTANNSGNGVFNGEAYDLGANDPVYTLGPSGVIPRPVARGGDLGGPSNVLLLFGTGWRAVSSLGAVQVSIGGIAVTPNYAGPSSSPGLDQLNLSIPFNLAGPSSQMVNVAVSFLDSPASTTGVFTANTVQFCLAGVETSSGCPAANPTPAPLCNQPLPGVAAPYAPHGLFVLQSSDQGVAPSVLTNIMNQSTVCGADLYVTWSQIDKGNGQYDWTSLDAQIAPWVAAGKSVNLIVWGVTDSLPNTGTPNYVLTDPTYQSVGCTTDGSLTLYSYPVYYSPGYQNHYKTLIQAVLNRYGSNPDIGYIRFGIARGGEAFPTCLTQMMQLGGYSISQFNAVWESYIAEITAFQKSVQTSILNTAGQVVQLMAALNQYGSPVQYAVTDFEAQNAVSLGFGFGSQGFELSDVSSYAAGHPCTSDWCANFAAFAGQVPLELQTIAASDPTNAAGGTGSMTMLLPFALSLHTQIFELYLQDLEVAYDPTNPNYAAYGAAYRQAFATAAAVLGGR